MFIIMGNILNIKGEGIVAKTFDIPEIFLYNRSKKNDEGGREDVLLG